MRRKRAKIHLTDKQRAELQTIVRRKSMSAPLVLRAKLLLYAEALQQNKAVASQLQVSIQLVGKWCHRWNDLIESTSIENCLRDGQRPGSPPKISIESLCRFVNLACDPPAKYDWKISNWSKRKLQEEAIKQGIFESISERHVGRLLKKIGLNPDKNEYWLKENAEEFRKQKIENIRALYKNADALRNKEQNKVGGIVEKDDGLVHGILQKDHDQLKELVKAN